MSTAHVHRQEHEIRAASPRTRTRTNTIPNGTKDNAAGLSGLRAIAQKAKNRRRGVLGGGVGHTSTNANERCRYGG